MPMGAEREPALRVCLGVEGFYPMGGTERQVVELAVELHRREIPVTVLSRWPIDHDNRYAAELRLAGVRLRTSGWRGRGRDRLCRVPYYWAKARAGLGDAAALEQQLWRRHSAKVRGLDGPGFVLHEVPFLGALSVAGRRALCSLGVPLVLSVLGHMEGVTPVVDIPGAVVTADGQPGLFPAGIPVTWVPSMGHRALAALVPDPERAPSRMILYGGRLVPAKGVDVLLRAVSLLPSTFKLVVAGDGPERPELERLARSLGVNAHFVGSLDASHVFELLQRCDVGAFPAVQGEGLPSFVVEALGAGTPVVGTDVGTVARALADGGGLVVPPRDPSAFAAGVRQLVEGDLVRHRRLARRAFEVRVSPSKVVDSYIQHYHAAIRQASGRRAAP
jgi:glycosyltransferase involved in cell wall biosynthesis